MDEYKKVKLGEVCEFVRNGASIKQNPLCKNGIPITRIETISNDAVKVILEGQNIAKSSVNLKLPNGIAVAKDVKTSQFNWGLAGIIFAILAVILAKAKKPKTNVSKAFLNSLQSNEFARMKNLNIEAKIQETKQKTQEIKYVLNSYQSNPQSKRINIDGTYFVNSLPLLSSI